MSYCVNCGVELSPGSTSCPLCSTPVINPSNPTETAETTPFSEKIVLPKSSRKRFAAYIVSMIMLIPNIVCIMANMIFDKGSHWSFYIAATTGLVWVLLVLPFCLKKHKAYILWAFDSVAVGSYTYFMFAMGGNEEWFLRCALPAICAASIFAIIYIIWYRKTRRSKTSQAIHLLGDIIICILVIGGQISYYYQSYTPIYICSIIVTSMLAVLAFLVACEKNKKLNAWLSRNFFVE